MNNQIKTNLVLALFAIVIVAAISGYFSDPSAELPLGEYHEEKISIRMKLPFQSYAGTLTLDEEEYPVNRE